MKHYTTYISATFIVLFSIACSRKKDKFISRNWHAMTTHYNTLYNGGVAFTEGRHALIETYEDNYWKQLPIERLEIRDEVYLKDENGDENFLRAEEKAAKAIQKHSMNIRGVERNFQIDEAFMLLGKARYFDQRFIQALEAFNYILANYPTCNNINNARIWKAKTYIRLENEEAAIKGLKEILPQLKKEVDFTKDEEKFIYQDGKKNTAKEVSVFNEKGNVKDKLHKTLQIKRQVLSDASAMLAQAYVNLKHKDSAISPMKVAIKYTKSNEERGRYHYILGQLYNSARERDSANMEFDKIIKLNRRTPREYLINAYLAKARNLEIESEDQLAFLDILNKLEKNWENRNFLDKIYYEKAIFFFGNDSIPLSEEYYKKSLAQKSKDTYLNSLSHQTLSRINFKRGDYEVAGKYMDSTLELLNENSKRFRVLLKKREKLDDVIKYERIISDSDSIISIVNMSEDERIAYYKNYTDSIKAIRAEELKKLKAKEVKALQEAGVFNSSGFKPKQKVEEGEEFYFYNPLTLANGKLEFERVFGKRELIDNWKVASLTKFASSEEVEEVVPEDYDIDKDPAYDPQTYIAQIPDKPEVIDSLKVGRNEAYYKLGTIYKEQLKEYDKASELLEALLQNEPPEKYILPVKYSLFKIYQSNGNMVREEKVKKDILKNHPNSRYAEIVKNPFEVSDAAITGVDKTYADIYRLYEKQEYIEALSKLDLEIKKYQSDPIVARFYLLKAYLLGRTKGVGAMGELIDFVVANYSTTEEGYKAIELKQNTLPYLENLTFVEDESGTKKHKLMYNYLRSNKLEANDAKAKLDTLIKKRNFNYLSTSLDFYSKDTILVLVHGLKGKLQANGLNTIISDKDNDWKLNKQGVVISSENYKVIQAKKKYEEYIKIQDSIN